MKLFCLCQIWALHLQLLLNNTTEWQLFTTYQTVFSHIIKLVKVVKNDFVEKIANDFLGHSKVLPKFDYPFWNDVTCDEYVLYADLLSVCDGIHRNTMMVLSSVLVWCEKKFRKSLASLVEKLQISLTNGKLISK